ncbi:MULTISPECIES: mannuronate-specific alginate lyase [unclassified Pseudomonas]|uniref:mannuronate-specific alginate lyase n=1 Tax=unclassified Pseudomonas TaxID=196821 RepID=UPI000DA6E58F|nr:MULTISPECIES: mannuronate-specific alginate lyase [unclassified Pseudomonas]MDW3713059.1 mannuronate-specific alginate lyase [Pseudomonas sp. 2023EL-01195]PZE14591.1 mannuronate-specific alginate lyase [Pseudomonas sp. 57B-090624]
MKHPLSLLAPCLLGGFLLVGQASAADLVPPRGYYAPVDIDDKKPEACKAPPQPYTAKLDFRSKYEGSDKARATLNPDAEKAFREKTADITEMERGVNKMVMVYMREGQRPQLECALQWMTSWAQANALLSTEYNHTGKSIRKWALGSLSSAYLRLKFSDSHPLDAYKGQTQVIESWFSRLADQTVHDWSGLPLKKINNHSYWAAWSVMATAVATNRRDLFDWSVDQFRVAASQVDKDGFLPNELKREQRALAYHNYSLPPLAMIAAFAQANGVDLREENNGALRRLGERVIAGVDDQEPFDDRTGKDQDMDELEKHAKFAWLEPWCALYGCKPDTVEWKDSMGPYKTFRLGGDVTQVFHPKKEGGSGS